MKIPFLDLRAAYEELKDGIDQAILRVASSGTYILGDEVQAFEMEFADYCGANYCVGVGNGLDALHLSLLAMGIQMGDEVIVPSNTYIATWLAVSHCGALPVPVEPCQNSHNIDVAKIEAAITPKTKVILPVHLYGRPADLDPIISLAKKYGLMVLEDAAQAHGATYKNRRIGAHGDAVAWSFYPGKNLGALGDGGAITTNNLEIAERVRSLRNYGSKVKYFNERVGFNSRLDPIQAAVLRVKLGALDEWNSRRVKIAKAYRHMLAGCEIDLPDIPTESIHAWHLFVIKSGNREILQEYLKSKDIDTIIHYPLPPHLQKAYRHLGYSQGSFPISETLASEVLSLPIGPHLTMQMVEYICKVVQKK